MHERLVAEYVRAYKPVFYYNPDPPVEFGAPGINLRVAWRNGAWLTATGNSFAAPHITGMVARILGKHPSLTPFQIKVILRELSANVAGGNQRSPQPGQPLDDANGQL